MTPGKAPSYSIPFEFILRIGISALFGYKRSFRKDALKLISRVNPPIEIIGKQNIPRQENFIITVNHYTRPGFNAWWLAWSVSAAVEQDIHWIMTEARAVDGKWYAAGLHSITHWVFCRIAKTYSFSTTPPISKHAEDAAERAESIDHILSLTGDNRLSAIGYSPEGRDHNDNKLSWPSYDTGRFVHQLNKTGFHILPVGVFEEDGQLLVIFGEPYDLGDPHSHANGEIDPVTFRLVTQRQIDMLLTRTVMRRIAVLLPERLQGEFK